MNNVNSVLLEGNLCRDPELSYTSKGTSVCTLLVASNRSYKVEDERQEEVSLFERPRHEGSWRPRVQRISPRDVACAWLGA